MSHKRRKHKQLSGKPSSSHSCFGQRVPDSSSGVGKQLLYRCPTCQHLWLQDGYQVRARLEAEEVATLAEHLSADLAHLPDATCRLCLFRAGRGAFGIDEYRGVGYGIIWQAAHPVGAHALASILAESRMHAYMVPDVVRDPHLARAILSWLHHAQVFPCIHVLDEQECTHLALQNPPGEGMTGTQGWQWKGAAFRLSCPPLSDTALVLLAFAQPRMQPLDLIGLVSLWRDLAAQALAGGLPGERNGPITS